MLIFGGAGCLIILPGIVSCASLCPGLVDELTTQTVDLLKRNIEIEENTPEGDIRVKIYIFKTKEPPPTVLHRCCT